MKTISKLQRNRIYKKVLFSLENDPINFPVFICNDLYFHVKRIDGYDRFIEDVELLDLFPEFAKFKREKVPNEGGWWPQDDRKSRIKAIKKCIEQTSRKKSK